MLVDLEFTIIAGKFVKGRCDYMICRQLFENFLTGRNKRQQVAAIILFISEPVIRLTGHIGGQGMRH
jgi:hypothetical protein